MLAYHQFPEIASIFMVTADASLIGTGTVLTQVEGGDGKLLGTRVLPLVRQSTIIYDRQRTCGPSMDNETLSIFHDRA